MKFRVEDFFSHVGRGDADHEGLSFDHMVLESFAVNSARSSVLCERLFSGNVVVTDCDANFRTLWGDFWAAATPRYDYVLTWDGPQEALALIPPAYQLVFEEGRLAIYARIAAPSP